MATLRNSNSPSAEETKPDPGVEPKKLGSLDTKQKHIFFRILKRLLEEPYSLQVGAWDEDQHAGSKFRLHYGKHTCQISISDADGHIQKKEVALLDVYLKWREGIVESLTLENLQTVQNELKFLGFKNEKVNACFSLARNEFIKEPFLKRRFFYLKIICEEVAFFFGQCNTDVGVTVMYDDKNKRAAYYLTDKENGLYTVKTKLG